MEESKEERWRKQLELSKGQEATSSCGDGEGGTATGNRPQGRDSPPGPGESR